MGPVTAVSVCHGARDSHVVPCDRRPCMGAAVVAHSDVAPVSRTQKLDSDSLQTPMTMQKKMGFRATAWVTSSVGSLERSRITQWGQPRRKPDVFWRNKPPLPSAFLITKNAINPDKLTMNFW